MQLFGDRVRTYNGRVVRTRESAWSEGASCFGQSRYGGHIRVYRIYDIQLEDGRTFSLRQWEDHHQRFRGDVLVDVKEHLFLGSSDVTGYEVRKAAR